MKKITSNKINESELDKEFAVFGKGIIEQLDGSKYGHLLILVDSKDLPYERTAEQISLSVKAMRASVLSKTISSMLKENFSFWHKIRFIRELL